MGKLDISFELMRRSVGVIEMKEIVCIIILNYSNLSPICLERNCCPVGGYLAPGAGQTTLKLVTALRPPQHHNTMHTISLAGALRWSQSPLPSTPRLSVGTMNWECPQCPAQWVRAPEDPTLVVVTALLPRTGDRLRGYGLLSKQHDIKVDLVITLHCLCLINDSSFFLQRW